MKLVTREAGSEKAESWFAAHLDDEVVAPSFMPAEVASALRRKLQPVVYDAMYLALAEKEHCELWTADAEFAKSASAKDPFVRAL